MRAPKSTLARKDVGERPSETPICEKSEIPTLHWATRSWAPLRTLNQAGIRAARAKVQLPFTASGTSAAQLHCTVAAKPLPRRDPCDSKLNNSKLLDLLHLFPCSLRPWDLLENCFYALDTVIERVQQQESSNDRFKDR